MVFGNKKKRGKHDQLMIVLVIGVLLFMSLSCGLISDLITIWNAVNFAFSLVVTPPVSPIVPGGGNQPYTPPRIYEPPITDPETPCPDEPPGPDDPTLPPFYKTEEHINLSAYYTVLEEDEENLNYSDEIYVPASKNQSGNVKTYLLANQFNVYTTYSGNALMADKYFLYNPGGLCTQGIGKLNDGSGMYISLNYDCHTWTYFETPPEDIGFEWKYRSDAEHNSILKPFETVAVCDPNNGGSFNIGDTIAIPYLKDKVPNNHDEYFTVTDTGGGLCKTEKHPRETIDIYVGIGNVARDDINYGTDNYIGIDDVDVFVYR